MSTEPEELNIKEIKAQYYRIFLHAYTTRNNTNNYTKIAPIYDSETKTFWPKRVKNVGIKINHDNKMVRVPGHGWTSFNRSTQNEILDELIEGYNSAYYKEAFINSLIPTNNSNILIKMKENEEKQNEKYLGGKKSRKLRKNKKRKTRRKNKKRKTRRKNKKRKTRRKK